MQSIRNSSLSLRWSVTILAGLLVIGGMSGCKGSNDGTTASSGTSTGTTGSSGGGGRPAMTAPPVKVTGNTIKIGLIASESGDLRPWGLDSIEGAKMAVDAFNAAGGLNGKKVELDIQDSQSKQDGAKTATTKVISDGVVAIVGEVSSGNTEQIARTAYAAGLPDVAIGATKTDLSQIGNNFFRVCYTDDLQGPVMAEFAYDQLGLRNVAIMTDNRQPYSQGLSKSFHDAFTKMGGTIVDEEKYETGDTTFSSQLTNIQAKNPDGIFMSGYFPEVGPIAAAARQMGITAKFMGGDGWDSPKLLDSGGQAILGSYMCNHYNNLEGGPKVQQFLADWKKTHTGLPGTTMAALGYDAMGVTLDALKRAKTLDSYGIRDALDDTSNYDGVSGTITLKGHEGNPPKRVLIVQIVPQSEGFQKFVKAYDATP